MGNTKSACFILALHLAVHGFDDESYDWWLLLLGGLDLALSLDPS